MKLCLSTRLVPKPRPVGWSSIGSRLFISVMTAACLGLGGLGMLFYHELEAARLLELSAATDIKVRELDTELRSSETFLKSLVTATGFLYDRGERSPQAYEQLVLAFMTVRPKLITGFGIMQTPQGLVNRQWFGPYIEEAHSNRGAVIPGHPKFRLVDLWQVDRYPQLQYYTDAVKVNRNFWTEPYFNQVYPVPLMTYAGPIRDRAGRLIAIMNGDINIADLNVVDLSQSDHDFHVTERANYVLVTRQGALLSYSANPAKAKHLDSITTIPVLREIWTEVKQLLDQGQVHGLLESDALGSYWVYQQIPSSQWVMLRSVPYAVVVRPALLGAIGTTLVVTVFLGLVVYVFIRCLNSRLQPILDECDAYTQHDDPTLHPIPRDELDRLSQAFFNMVNQQNSLLHQLQLMNAELSHANQLKDEFLAIMSHELRTPLNAILGITEGLQDQVFGGINDEQLRALGTIEASGFHLLDLINDILDLAKIDAGDLGLDCQPTAVLPLCESSLALVKPQANKKQLEIILKLSPNLPDLLVDQQRIRQVLVNLLSNAMKFTPNGGRVTLEVAPLPVLPSENGMELPPYRLRMAVIDTGIGIASEYLSQLFQPFVQLDSALNRQYEGTGLGLALVQRLVDLHGGQVGVTSQVGVGSCFTVDLPCVASDFDVSQATAVLPIAPTGQSINNHDVVILIAEDNPANISTVSNYLQAKGYRMVLASDGALAISLTQKTHPDLILMDLHMPGMNGFEAIASIRALPDCTDIPIIVVTALTEVEVRNQCFAVGATDYLPKPIQLKQLLMMIERCLACRGRWEGKCGVNAGR